MKELTVILTILTCFIVAGCTSLTASERHDLRMLQSNGITVDHPKGNFEKPNSQVAAAALNMLPGFGNFYLAMGSGGDSSHALYGCLNLLTWPISILWGIPEAAIDAGSLNKRELLYYYKFDSDGKQVLEDAGITFQ